MREHIATWYVWEENEFNCSWYSLFTRRSTAVYLVSLESSTSDCSPGLPVSVSETSKRLLYANGRSFDGAKLEGILKTYSPICDDSFHVRVSQPK